MKQVAIVQDDSSHWYIIPFDLKEDFDNLCYNEEKETQFINKYSKYMTGGCINSIKLYADI